MDFRVDKVYWLGDTQVFVGSWYVLLIRDDSGLPETYVTEPLRFLGDQQIFGEEWAKFTGHRPTNDRPAIFTTPGSRILEVHPVLAPTGAETFNPF
jgi:hypothetical protein